MKKYFFLCLVTAGALVLASCAKSTNSEEYASVWKPYSGTVWTSPSNVLNFTPTTGGFTFDANISTANAVDTLGINLTFQPTMYQISNFSTASDAQLSVAVSILSLDSMKLQTMKIDPVSHDTTLYTKWQFGKVRGLIQTMGGDSAAVFTAPRAFASDNLFTYAPSVHPDSCSKKISLKLILNWNKYTGSDVVTDTLKTTKITVWVKNMNFTVNGVDILK